MRKSEQQEHLKTFARIPLSAEVRDVRQHPNTVELVVDWDEPRGDGHACPSCGSTWCVTKDSGAWQTVRHVKCGFQGTLVTFHKPRLACRSCGKSFYVRPDWIDPHLSITRHLFLDIYGKLTTTPHCVTEVARETGATPSIVRAVMDDVYTERPASLPKAIGIDEFHGRTGSYDRKRRRYETEKYHCVITNAGGDGKSLVVDILYKATADDVIGYFMQYPPDERRAVRYFCTDMRPGFSKVARACFPNAKVCIDPFHVAKLVTGALSEVRTDEWQRLRKEWRDAHDRYKAREGDKDADGAGVERLKAEADRLSSDYKLVKNSQRLLATSPKNGNRYWNLNDDGRRRRLERIFALSKDLEAAHSALLEFYDVFGEDEFRCFRDALAEWTEKYAGHPLAPLRQAALTVRKFRGGIENARRYHRSNSPTEGLNKKIKDVKRLGFGAHDFENFRKRALLACGRNTVLHDDYTIFRERLSGPDIPDGKGAPS